MQKKMILQQKPLPRQKKLEQCARAAVVTLAKEKHLIIWLYDNSTSTLPELTIACTKDRYALYDSLDHKWKTCGLYNLMGHSCRLENAKMPKKEEELVKQFVGDKSTSKWRNWDSRVNEIRWAMRRKDYERKYETRAKKLNERCESLHKVPKAFYKWCEKEYQHSHTLAYKIKGNKATVQCSCCGNVDEYRFRSDTYEQLYERAGVKPENNQMGICRLCGAVGTFRAAGYYKGVYAERKSACYLEQTKNENTVVIRYFEICLTQTSEWEKTKIVEIARTFLEEGKAPQIDYNKIGGYTGKSFWDDCNLSGSANIKIKKGKIWQESLNEIKKTRFKYSALELYQEFVDKDVDILKYYTVYNEYQALEMIVKMKMWKLAKQLVNNRFYLHLNKKGKTPSEFLMIDKKKFKRIQSAEGDVKLLDVLQFEKKHNLDWDDDIEDWCVENMFRVSDCESILQFVSMRKAINYVEKYYDATDSYTSKSLLMSRYRDYLLMRDELGYDMNKSTILYPRNLKKEHDKLVAIRNKKAQDEQKRAKEQKYPNIKKQYKKLSKKYGYQANGYIIRPCDSASEIVDEGRLQHHCVGGDHYLNKHNQGKTFILVLRKEETPETPFVTVEIDKDYKVLQWYGPHDRKDNEKIGLSKDEIDTWLEQYTGTKTKKNSAKAAETDGSKQMLAPAV